MSQSPGEGGQSSTRGPVTEAFLAFLKLGVTSFGGPIAHLGYFQRELIERRGWMDEERYAQLVALCQLLPGPASSQLGFALGLIRAGWRGALAAFIGFTLPSALLLFVFAAVLPVLDDPVGRAALHGLKLVAVAVVAQGVLLMARRLTPDAPRALLAAAAAAFVLMVSSTLAQLAVVVLGGTLGLIFLRSGTSPVAPASFHLHYGKRTGGVLLGGFAALLALALIPHGVAPLWATASAFYRSGALVFGGGHVVLPLLREAVVTPGWVSTEDFLAGYGAAQVVPGPLFSVAAFLGARLQAGQGAVLGAGVALAAIFLPGLFLVAGALPFWRTFASRQGALSTIRGVNAAVVGLLAAALYDPLWKSAVLAPSDFAIALVAFVVLVATRLSILIVLAGCVLASVARLWM
jgi:chromate transporter